MNTHCAEWMPFILHIVVCYIIIDDTLSEWASVWACECCVQIIKITLASAWWSAHNLHLTCKRRSKNPTHSSTSIKYRYGGWESNATPIMTMWIIWFVGRRILSHICTLHSARCLSEFAMPAHMHRRTVRMKKGFAFGISAIYNLFDL